MSLQMNSKPAKGVIYPLNLRSENNTLIPLSTKSLLVTCSSQPFINQILNKDLGLKHSIH